MYSSRVKTGAFVLEGLNSISTTYYFFYVFFFLKEHFGFGSRENLTWAIAHGAVYVVASWQGGRFGQRRGYLKAMQLGFAGMSLCFFTGWLVNLAEPGRTLEIVLQAALMLGATVAICFTWPNLEAIVSEGEPGHRLQRLIGIYNLVWSGAGALAYFTGGALMELLGGRNQIFLVPALMIAAQWGLATWLASQPGAKGGHGPAIHGSVASPEERRRSAVPPKAFLLMSWLANPCAYIAIATAIPLIPTLAGSLELTPRTAGFFCSIWLFSRTLTFVGLWMWNGWHYRFRWLFLAFVGLIGGFLFIFLGAGWTGLTRGQALLVVGIAQTVFGVALGLIYYSSLFYSMDVGDTKGDHGGIHEAAIGAGILGGPLVGAMAQWLRPGSPTAAAWAVSGVLGLGFLAILWMRSRAARPGSGGSASH
ncbi:MAG: MFS transporter [Verrucomicrobiae bacterium]|nr:MFS transporter [Verrucomicrobiae bacterium]